MLKPNSRKVQYLDGLVSQVNADQGKYTLMLRGRVSLNNTEIQNII